MPGANDTSADALNILPYYPSANGQEGYLNGGWTGVGSGSPNAFGYISPANQNSVYIAPNITFDFSEVQYDKKTPSQSLADWETLFSQMSANSNTPIIVWPWHDYGVTDWNTTTDAPNAGLYSTQLFTDFVQFAFNAGYEFVTSEDLAARIAAEQRSVIKETNPTANTINVTVTPGQATDDLGAMALNLSNGGGKVIQNAGSWYAYDTNSLFMAKGGVSNVTATLGAAQDDVSHVDYLPMRADLQSVTGDGSNLNFSFTGDGAVHAHLKTPGTEHRLGCIVDGRDRRSRRDGADRNADRRRTGDDLQRRRAGDLSDLGAGRVGPAQCHNHRWPDGLYSGRRHYFQGPDRRDHPPDGRNVDRRL